MRIKQSVELLISLKQNYLPQSTTRLTINGNGIETVKDIKLLGTVVTQSLKLNKKRKKSE